MDKILSNAKKGLICIGVVYLIMTILASVSAISDMKNMSSTSITVTSIFSLIWFQALIILAFAFTYFIYVKKGSKGIIFEFTIGFALFINVVINMFMIQSSSPLVLLNFVIPTVVLVHSFFVLFSIYKCNKNAKIKDLFSAK